MTLFRSPAKLNLFLSVIGKRADGYHELASLFQAIDLSDTLSFDLASEDRFTCSDPSLPLDSSNLVLKALDLFRKKSSLNFPVKIHLEKNIPSEAGLGGGSSNAATTLFALNSLANFRYSEKQLQMWSAEIGSDMAFFFSQGTAYCTGRGEVVRDLPKIELEEMTITKPRIGLSTPKVFSCLNLANLEKRDTEFFLKEFYAGKHQFFNDLEAAAFQAEPKLIDFKNSLLQSGFNDVHMTGSGTAFFCKGSGTFFPDAFFCKSSPIHREKNRWY